MWITPNVKPVMFQMNTPVHLKTLFLISNNPISLKTQKKSKARQKKNSTEVDAAQAKKPSEQQPRVAVHDTLSLLIQKPSSNYLFNDCLRSLIFCWVISPLEKSKTSSLRSWKTTYYITRIFHNQIKWTGI